MGRLRSALRAYALESDDPAEVLSKLDRKVQHFEPGALATVVYGSVSASRDRVAISLAGHLPPVLAHTDTMFDTISQAPHAPSFAMPDQQALEELLATFAPGVAS